MFFILLEALKIPLAICGSELMPIEKSGSVEILSSSVGGERLRTFLKCSTLTSLTASGSATRFSVSSLGGRQYAANFHKLVCFDILGKIQGIKLKLSGGVKGES